MEEIIHAFGIDWRLIVIQMFNFMILGAALWYFLYTPVLKVLNEREAKLKKGVEDADKAAQSLLEANTEKTALLTTARKEAETLVEEASRHAETKGSGIVKEAEERAQRMIEDAKMRAEEEKKLAKKASEAEIAAAAILTAEKILKERQ